LLGGQGSFLLMTTDNGPCVHLHSDPHRHAAAWLTQASASRRYLSPFVFFFLWEPEACTCWTLVSGYTYPSD
jgi:hypothetical protein